MLANAAIHAMLVGAVMFRERVAATPLVLMAGGITYPLYLLHQHAGYVAINALAPRLGAWGAALATILLMLLASWAVWRFVERPARRRIIAALGPAMERLTALLSRMAATAGPRS